MNDYRIYPAVPLRGLTILPGMVVHFDISRGQSLKAVQKALETDRMIFLVSQKDDSAEKVEQKDLCSVGILAEVRQTMKMQDKSTRVLADGLYRAKLEEFYPAEGCFQAGVEVCEEQEVEEAVVAEAMAASIRETFANYAEVQGRIGKECRQQVEKIGELGPLMDYIGNSIPLPRGEKQALLEETDLTGRYHTLLVILFRHIEVLTIKNEFQARVRARIDKHQKEYILREQLGVIREELGETADSEAEEYHKKCQALEASSGVKEHIEKEIRRFRAYSPNAAESNVSRNYIETLLELPWDKKTEDSHDLARAREILERDHYGLEDVKERILDFLAVRSLTEKGEAPVICLVGPPGTGKTSIAKSIAEALGKKYVRICLGGVRDEAEVRGHRKTYVGAMPGRIVDGLRQAGVSNPLMLLDEIDKLSNDYKGDPSAALLEALDTAQNARFRDHFVEMPIDLSDVLFICTANNGDAIPRPLMDRMEIIEVTGYTENEKYHIAKDHLLKKVMEANGLKEGRLVVTDPALRQIIDRYTREAGVRQLERTLGKLCRKTARFLSEKGISDRESGSQTVSDRAEETSEAQTVSDRGQEGPGRLRITENNLEKYLGKPGVRPDRMNETDQVGVVRGLAWTAVGGVTLQVEVNTMPGKGALLLTGKLGEVMKESARIALSYVRSIAADYSVPAEFFEKNDLHIHIPEGATPKDGPSAGITMATALLSAAAGIPVRRDAAMTGEITLRGNILPIGGLKEKLLAAGKAGAARVYIPEGNRRDLEEISSEITGQVEVIPVQSAGQVIEGVFVR